MIRVLALLSVVLTVPGVFTMAQHQVTPPWSKTVTTTQMTTTTTTMGPTVYGCRGADGQIHPPGSTSEEESEDADRAEASTLLSGPAFLGSEQDSEAAASIEEETEAPDRAEATSTFDESEDSIMSVEEDCVQTWVAEHNEEIKQLMMASEKTQPEDLIGELVKAINDGTLKHSEVPFLLFYDTLRLKNCADIRLMRYHEITMAYCTYIRRKHGAAVLNSLRGWKFVGGYRQRKEHLPGCDADIIFAIPSNTALENWQKKSQVGPAVGLEPGIHTDILKELSQHHQGQEESWILSWDGRKVQPNTGETDLGGLEEDGLTATARKEKRESEEIRLKIIEEILSDSEEKPDLNDVQEAMKELSQYNVKLRDSIQKKDLCLKKMLKEVDGDWQKSDHRHLISWIIALQADLKAAVCDNLQAIDQLGQLTAALSGVSHLWSNGQQVGMNEQANWRKLQPVQGPVQPIFTQQRTEQWQALRDEADVTGSAIHRAIGMDTLKAAAAYHDHKKKGMELPPLRPGVKSLLEIGTREEPNILATTVAKVLPSYLPDLELREVGCVKFRTEGGSTIVDSPDGLLYQLHSDVHSPATMAVEFKFVTNEYLPAHPRLYNILQCFCHCAAAQVNKCLLIYQNKEACRAFILDFDASCWNLATSLIDRYLGPDGTRPKKKGEETGKLQTMLRAISSQCEVLCEFLPTLYTTHGEYIRQEDSPFYLQGQVHPKAWTDQDLQLGVKALQKAQKALKKCHQLTQQYAREELQFLLTSLHRTVGPERVLFEPAAYFLEACATLPASQMRILANAVLDAVHDAGIHCPVASADGAYEYFVSNGFDGKPCTHLAFVRHLWFNALKSLSKRDAIVVVSNMIADAWWPWEATYNVDVAVQTPEPSLRVVIRSSVRRQFPEAPSCQPLTTRDFGLQFPGECEEGTPSLVQHLIAYPAASPKTCHQFFFKTDGTPASDGKETGADNVLQDLVTNLDLDESAQEDFQDFCENNPSFVTSNIQGETEEGNVTAISSIRNLLSEDVDQTPPTSRPVTPVHFDQPSDTRHSQRTLTDNQYDGICQALKTDKKTAKKWNDRTTEQLKDLLSHQGQVSNLTVDELKVILRQLKETFANVRLGRTKTGLCEQLSQIVGGQQLPVPPSMLRNPKTLRELSIKALSSKSNKKEAIVSSILNTSGVGDKALQDLKKERRTVDDPLYAPEVQDGPINIYYHPPLTSRGYLQAMSIDHHHQRQIIRTCVLKGKFPDICPNAWKQVAKEGCTRLTSVMVEVNLDQQSASITDIFFSPEVATSMERLGFKREAEFTNRMIQWHDAWSQPGIHYIDRVKMDRQFTQFEISQKMPLALWPPRQYYSGLFWRTADSILANSDVLLLLPVTSIHRVVLSDHPVFDIRKPGRQKQKTVPGSLFAPQHSSEGVRQHYKSSKQLERQLPHVRAGISIDL
uniref:SAP domain-containing protein n=1 Tax=Branchiostoma floridae TaxID=7739 RepID=C3Z2L2_BRAFL|eukprot:XP_002597251.1 hypothetical protein BRAFLDRAFT_66387 [Branchiostoma floridae]